MNIIPQSENLGNTVRVGGGGGPSNIKLQRDENGGQESEEDEEFMALMNESKSKEPGSAPFQGDAGLPGGFSTNDEGSAFQIPAATSPGPRNYENSFGSSAETPSSPSFAPPTQPSGNFRSLEEEKQHYLYKIQRLQNRFPGRRV